ncbi:hypothetical protein V511_09450 [Mesotoga sp. Brook.08.YT.4.2.5.1]|nr:hypothetical protein V511_09450 [Mesotoga sp. Brook.08.YT.4.2.5.1]PNS41426.1 hypothetical protein RJ60_04805 [Mesotoga sp. B105.6.4]PVD16392.1 hypothetical protein V512_005525 [Mesotoga sp. Brook.08.105.5.1]RAO96203.1 hypothetical protein M388_14770 [Mesotoga sp. Brook.08.YT.4.2.5.4.]RDI93558.1 hypothetical protein Q502_04860 [Mesotoga sp. Brook.08.YT.4.2.5.2.]
MDGGPLTDNVVFVSVQRVLALKRSAELLAYNGSSGRDPVQRHHGMTVFSCFRSSWQCSGQDLVLFGCEKRKQLQVTRCRLKKKRLSVIGPLFSEKSTAPFLEERFFILKLRSAIRSRLLRRWCSFYLITTSRICLKDSCIHFYDGRYAE